MPKVRPTPTNTPWALPSKFMVPWLINEELLLPSFTCQDCTIPIVIVAPALTVDPELVKSHAPGLAAVTGYDASQSIE